MANVFHLSGYGAAVQSRKLAESHGADSLEITRKNCEFESLKNFSRRRSRDSARRCGAGNEASRNFEAFRSSSRESLMTFRDITFNCVYMFAGAVIAIERD